MLYVFGHFAIISVCPYLVLKSCFSYQGDCENVDDICCPLNDLYGQKCGVAKQTDTVRVLSRDTTNFAEYPWIVAVLHLVPTNKSDGGMMEIFTASGSLIHPKVVMTAAHNVHKLTDLKIRAGEWDTTSTDEELPHQERDVDRIILHEAYNTRRKNLHNDIALLVLDKPVDIKPNVNTVCLPSSTQPPAPGTKCVSSGWGKDKFGEKGEFQSIPKKVELPIVNHSKCQRTLRRTRLGPFFKLHKSFVCAGGEPGKDTCTGDGGSPLMCPVLRVGTKVADLGLEIPMIILGGHNAAIIKVKSKRTVTDPDGIPGQALVQGEKSRYMASGIVAWGIECGGINPGVYADVAYLKPWVDGKMAELGYPTTFYTI